MPADLTQIQVTGTKLLPRSDVLSWLVPVLLLAALVTAIDIFLSTRLGLLANPVLYDGLTYLIEAELGPTRQFVRSTAETGIAYWEVAPVSTFRIDYIPLLGLFRKHAPLWN